MCYENVSFILGFVGKDICKVNRINKTVSKTREIALSVDVFSRARFYNTSIILLDSLAFCTDLLNSPLSLIQRLHQRKYHHLFTARLSISRQT